MDLFYKYSQEHKMPLLCMEHYKYVLIHNFYILLSYLKNDVGKENSSIFYLMTGYLNLLT